LSAGSYFLVRVGQVGRQLLLPWVWSSFWASAWPPFVVSLHGQRTTAGALAPWLSQTVYHQSLSAWLLESGVMGSLPAVAMVLLGWWYVRQRTQRPTLEEHLRGVRLLSAAQLQVQIDAAQGAASPSGLIVAGVEIPAGLETSHIAVCGSTGTGKSTIL